VKPSPILLDPKDHFVVPIFHKNVLFPGAPSLERSNGHPSQIGVLLEVGCRNLGVFPKKIIFKLFSHVALPLH
jgi:hypothetical protein